MRFSILTPCLNRASHVATAIASVLAQGWPEFEHIILDGGSTDGTLEVLARHPHLRVVSEPDHGIYDAMNKGLALPAGDVVGWLNTDDAYEPGAFAAVAQAFTAHPEAEVVCGGARIVEESTGRITHEFVTAAEIGLSWTAVTVGAPIPNAKFFRREALARIGPFDTREHVAADRDWLIRALLAGVRSVALERCVYRYSWHAGAATFTDAPGAAWRVCRESMAIAERHLAAQIPEPGQAALRGWHGRLALEAVYLSFRAHHPGAALAAARRGWAINALWPVTFARAAAQRLRRGWHCR